MGIVELFGRRMIKVESVLEFLEKIFIVKKFQCDYYFYAGNSDSSYQNFME